MDKTTLLKAFLIGITAVLTGCAVLTVDVDVYKGPLANHEDIQIEQMAAMAIGAKPLLIELRDRLEANYMNTLAFDVGCVPNSPERKSQLEAQLELYRKLGKGRTKTRLLALHNQNWYKPNFVKPYLDEGGVMKSRFLDSNADHVNTILSLYEDRGHVELHYTIFKILARYRESYAILRPQDMAEDKALVKEIKEKVEKKVKKKAETEVQERTEKENKEKAVNDPNALDLLNVYMDYLNSNQRDAKKVIDVTLKYLKTAEPNSPLLIELNRKEDSDKNAIVNVTNAAQNFMAETKLVDDCADLIFGPKGKLRDQFVTRVKEIARAYLDCRTALEDLWLTTMDGIININCQPVDPNKSSDRDELTANIVNFSLEIIQPRYLAVLLDADKKKSISKDIRDLAVSLGPYPSADPAKDQWDFTQMKWYLSDKLKKEPVKTAVVLKMIHEFCKYELDPGEASIREYVKKSKYLGSFAYKEGWKFGLVRAPFDDLDPKQLAGFAGKVFAHEGGAFAGGRLDKGLESLIEDYLNLADKTAPGKSQESELEAARQVLSDALVRFAEKLLFVANNRSLMSPTKTDYGLLSGTVVGFYRLLFGQTIVDNLRDIGWIPSSEDTEQYTRILQAVGNSILVQADALHQEKIHEEGSKNRLDSEIHAVIHTLRQSPSHMIDRLLEALTASQAARTKELQQAQNKFSAVKEELDRANEDLEKAMEQVKNIDPQNDETFVKAAKRQERKVISAHLLLVSEEPGDQTTQNARDLATAAQHAALASEPNNPKKCAEVLAEQLGIKAKVARIPDVNDLLCNANSYFIEKLDQFPSDVCDDANEAYKEVISVVKVDYLGICPWIRLAGEADKAQERVDRQKKIVEDTNNLIGKAESESTKIENAIDAIVDVKYTVLQKADEVEPNQPTMSVHKLLLATLHEKLSNAENEPEVSEKLKNAVAVIKDQPPPIKPIVFDKSKLPPKSTAKDVRDIWITLLEYEHDLALRNGDEDRAKEIMEAIEEARKKREGMIFIRPAMAYLRTSFPATSLQGNPNLTWDNMLGGHMIRSIPFAPQIGEFLNPDAKRDARITAEIDKQFWQNINRVRVAGGGNTNYAVVKDDIGNWYVKGYSANPEDIIQSAQNLALFSAGGKMGSPSLVPSALAEKPNQVRGTPGSTLESILSKYEENYREKTEQGHKLLWEIMNNSENNIKKQIKDLWNANENVKNKQGELETALNWSYTHFLNQFASDIKNNEKDIGKQRKQIIEGIKRLTQFRNDLIWKITNVYKQNDESTNSKTAGKEAAKSIVRNVVNSQIDDLLANRKEAIKTYENALMFLAEATQPQEK